MSPIPDPTSAPSPGRDNRWLHLLWIGPILLVLAAGAVLLANLLRNTPLVGGFIEQFPGEAPLPAGAPVGFPAWLGWQHFFNGFLILLIIRSGWQIRFGGKPTVFWTRRNTGLFRTKNPPRRINLTLWLHLSLDVLWVLNGLVFYILIFVTGQWVRIVPTSWDIVPHALSTTIQYVSLNWPVANGWVNYNALQLLSYFLVVFIASPLAIITGIRMSPVWPRSARKLSKRLPVQWAIKVHFPVMLFFVLFIVAHVTLVLTTGALRNLNHMYGQRDDESWVGFWYFAASIVVMIVGVILARPFFLRSVAALGGKVD